MDPRYSKYINQYKVKQENGEKRKIKDKKEVLKIGRLKDITSDLLENNNFGKK